MLLTALLLCFPTAPCAAPLDEPAPRPTYKLPPGPVADRLASPGAAEALAAHRARKAAGEVGPAWAGLGIWSSPAGVGAWEGDSNWTLWRDLLAHTSDAPAEHARPNHFWLAQIARAQGRDDDAWTHLAELELGDLHDALEVLIPNHAGPLPSDGPLLLSPMLPPVPVFDPLTWEGLPPLREYVVEGLRLGPTTLDLTVSVPREGVEVRLAHRSGPPLTLAVHIPTPSDRESSLQYVDWERIDEPPFAHAIQLLPGAEESILWSRCMPSDQPWPQRSTNAPFPPGRDLVVETTPDDPALAQLTSFAKVLDELLDNQVRLRTVSEPGTSEEEPGLTALRIDLRPGPKRLDKLRAILSQVERYLLSRD
ncbi:MAG: hypothetical protein P1V81_02690 [Planctomycetota bacterium]|nr:hypothetical protein [Planctomycetota bacterium]